MIPTCWERFKNSSMGNMCREDEIQRMRGLQKIGRELELEHLSYEGEN